MDEAVEEVEAASAQAIVMQTTSKAEEKDRLALQLRLDAVNIT